MVKLYSAPKIILKTNLKAFSDSEHIHISEYLSKKRHILALKTWTRGLTFLKVVSKQTAQLHPAYLHSVSLNLAWEGDALILNPTDKALIVLVVFPPSGRQPSIHMINLGITERIRYSEVWKQVKIRRTTVTNICCKLAT